MRKVAAPCSSALWVSALAASASLSSSAGAEECSYAFAPDRPGAANGHDVIGPGCVLLEAAVQVDRAREGTSLAFPSLVRVGVHEVVEVRAATEAATAPTPDERAGGGITPGAALEAKVTGAFAEGRRPGVGALAGVSSELHAGFVEELSPYAQLLADWPLLPRFNWALHLELGAQPAGETYGARHGRLTTITVVAYHLPEPAAWLGLYADAQGGLPLREGAAWEQILGTGASFAVTGRFQVDTYVNVTVVGEERPVSVGAGMALGL